MTALHPGDPRFPWLPKHKHRGLCIFLRDDHPYLPDGVDIQLSRRFGGKVWTSSYQITFAEIRSSKIPARVLVARAILVLRHYFSSHPDFSSHQDR